jgi:hypothetical protein
MEGQETRDNYIGYKDNCYWQFFQCHGNEMD